MAVAEIGSSVVHAGVAFWLLATGHGIMSAVHSAVAREAALLLGLAWTARWLPAPRFGFDALRRILAFGLNLTGSRCLNYLNSNLARVVIGWSLGMEALGFYSFAYRLTLMPLVRISTVISRVFFPTFSAIGDDDGLLRRAYLRSVQAIALAYWPILATLFVLAEPVVLLAGLNMGPAVWPVRLLALATVIKAVGAAVGSVFLAKGRASWALYWSMFSLVVLIPSLYWGGSYGIEGVCAVLAVTGLLFLTLSQHLANRLMAMDFSTYASVLWRPALVAMLTGATTLAILPLLPTTPVIACVLGGLAAAAAVLVGLRLIAWKDITGMWRSARGTSTTQA
jgi:O-antigen/teichoic acid export membrane protein